MIFQGRPVVPGKHAAGQRSDHAEEERAQDVSGCRPDKTARAAPPTNKPITAEYEKAQHFFLPFT